MSNFNHVAAAIGGKPDAFDQFFDALRKANISDDNEILRLFKVINHYGSLNVYAFYSHNALWNISSENTWRSLCKLAEEFKLSWVFYRAGACYDAHQDDNSHESYFINKMLFLFKIQHPVSIIDNNLSAVLER